MTELKLAFLVTDLVMPFRQTSLLVMDQNTSILDLIELPATTIQLSAHWTTIIIMIQPSSMLHKRRNPPIPETHSASLTTSSIHQDFLTAPTTELVRIIKSTLTQRAVSSEVCQLPFAHKTKMIEIESVRVN